ncbi:MAG: hypothetical protein NPIRA02_20360 [Nitrospirales bacterium]|nr:MAG: hypothetical protein NPIRA02_20360 [Nitrospirales bacterium]
MYKMFFEFKKSRHIVLMVANALCTHDPGDVCCSCLQIQRTDEDPHQVLRSNLNAIWMLRGVSLHQVDKLLMVLIDKRKVWWAVASVE